MFANGNVIVYTLSEDEVSGYNTEVSQRPQRLCEKSAYKNRLCEECTQIIRFFVRDLPTMTPMIQTQQRKRAGI